MPEFLVSLQIQLHSFRHWLVMTLWRASEGPAADKDSGFGVYAQDKNLQFPLFILTKYQQL